MTDSPMPDEKDIEITPEMIEAGLSEFSAQVGPFCDSTFFSEAAAIQAVYTAMRRLEERELRFLREKTAVVEALTRAFDMPPKPNKDKGTKPMHFRVEYSQGKIQLTLTESLALPVTHQSSDKSPAAPYDIDLLEEKLGVLVREYLRKLAAGRGESVTDRPTQKFNLPITAAIAGGEELAACMADGYLTAKPNWTGEIAARVFRVMLRECVGSNALAIPEEPESHRECHPRVDECVPRS